MNTINIKFLFFLLSMIAFPFLKNYGQVPDYGKAKLKRIAFAAERLNDYYTAIDYLEAYLEKAPKNSRARYKLANYYRKIRDYKQAHQAYKTVYEENPKRYKLALFYQARMEMSLGKEKEAFTHFDAFYDNYRKGKESRKYRRLAKFAMESIENETPTDSLKAVIKPLSDSINKAHQESAPFFLEENTMVYSSMSTNEIPTFEIEQAERKPQPQFYQAVRKNDEWHAAGRWNDVIFDPTRDIGNGALSPDGNSFYFTICEISPIGEKICAIWKSDKVGELWGEPVKLPENINHPAYTSTQPAIGTDEKGRKILYFVSNRKGGKGGLDIWYSIYRERNRAFRDPRNSGSKVNSVGDEMTPFFHAANRTLYFSSNGHPGLGGFDVFKTTGERSRWEEPTPLAKPINSGVDEVYFRLSPSGEEGFFASNRKGSNSIVHEYCCDDLYYFIFPGFVNIQLKLRVEHAHLNHQFLEGAKIKVFRLKEDEEEPILVQQYSSRKDTSTDIQLEAGYDYLIQAKKEGFLLNEFEFNAKNKVTSETVYKRIKLDLLPRKAIQIDNIYYESNQSELTEANKAVVDTTILKILKDNPEIIVEISSHTDSKGTKPYNLKLSQDRAEELLDYLVEKGIDKKRLRAKGYGMEKPVAPNENEDGSINEEGRALNRRTEIKIIETMQFQEFEEED